MTENCTSSSYRVNTTGQFASALIKNRAKKRHANNFDFVEMQKVNHLHTLFKDNDDNSICPVEFLEMELLKNGKVGPCIIPPDKI